MVIALYGVVLPQSAKAISNDFTKSQNYCIQPTCDVTLSKEIIETDTSPRLFASANLIEIANLPEPQAEESSYCSCVIGLNKRFGTNFKTLDGFARSIPTNSTVAAKSGFVVTYESRPGTKTGHIAYYVLDDDQKNITIEWESNFIQCKVSSGRKIPVNSTLIKGYIN